MYNITTKNTYIEILVDKDELNLNKTLDSGQSFRWIKDEFGKWIGVVNNKIWILKQEGNVIYTNLKEEDKNELISYFNLDMDYATEISKIKLTEFEKKAYEKSKGIHILRQDLFETIVTFLMSPQNTMTNIRRIIDGLCETYGEELSVEYNGKTIIRKSFPSIEILVKVSIEDFKNLRMGYRADYLYNTCKYLVQNKYFLDSLKKYNYETSLDELKKLNGVGDKVANCIALFALHHIEAFPIDTHIKQLIETEYGGKIDLKRFGNIAGIMQQYMFYYKAFS